MSSPVLTVAPETPVRDAVQLMLGNHVSGLPVVDARGHLRAEGRAVGEVMTPHVITADEETAVHELAARMVRHQINRLPIVRGREVVGIVTRADILKAFLRSNEDLAAEAQRIVDDFIRPLEEVRASVKRGVLVLRGRLASPGRRATLLAPGG